MGLNPLIEELRKDSKTGEYFQANGTYVSYKTGFPALDYYLGMRVNVFNDDGEVVDRYPCIGIAGGSIVTVVGKSHVGKCQPMSTRIPTPSGVKRLGNIRVGDQVFNAHGKPVTVTGVFDNGKKKVYKITIPSTTRTTYCSGNHIWRVYDPDKGMTDKTLDEIIAEGPAYKEVALSSQKDSSFRLYRVFIPDADIVEYDAVNLENPVEYGKNYATNRSDASVLHDDYEYPIGSVTERALFLKGYMEGMNAVQSSPYRYAMEIPSYRYREAKFIECLCNSLGLFTTMILQEEESHNASYKIEITLRKEINDIMKVISDKVSIPDSFGMVPMCWEETGREEEMRCILVDDEEHLYLTSSYIVTHNTSLAIQIASNIVRPFPSGFVIHYDLEKSTNYTRIGALSKYKASEMKEGKYILRQEKCSMEEMKKSFAEIYRKKTSNPIYQYDTGLVNEFGEKIIAYEPTCVIIDSAPRMSTYINPNTKDGIADMDSISTQTDRMRLTSEIGRFLSESMEMLKSANIIVFIINHIKDRPPMGVPQAPELPGMTQNETLPAGKALQYYTSYMFRLTAIGAEKYTPEEDGFDGFGATGRMMKNRGNVNGTMVPLVFDKVHGYDSLRSSISYAKSIGMLGGNRAGYYFINNKEYKFKAKEVHQAFAENRELYKIMYDHILPELDKVLSSAEPQDMVVIEEEYDY